MNLDFLRKYQNILYSIERLTDRAADSVQASSAVHPYTKHSITIQGAVSDNLTSLTELVRLQSQKREIENCIHNLPNRKLRDMADLYANGKSWKHIAKETKCKSPDAARMQLKRALEK